MIVHSITYKEVPLFSKAIIPISPNNHLSPCDTLVPPQLSIKMDKLSGLASKLGGGSSNKDSSSSGSAGKEDYVDKGEFQC